MAEDERAAVEVRHFDLHVEGLDALSCDGESVATRSVLAQTFDVAGHGERMTVGDIPAPIPAARVFPGETLYVAVFVQLLKTCLGSPTIRKNTVMLAGEILPLIEEAVPGRHELAAITGKREIEVNVRSARPLDSDVGDSVRCDLEGEIRVDVPVTVGGMVARATE